MPTLLKTKLLPTDNSDNYLLICGVSDLNTSGLDHFDTRYAVALHGSLGKSGSVDLLAALSVARLPSKGLSKSRLQLAQTQLDLAKSGEYGPEMAGHYRDNHRRFTYTGEMAMTEQLWLPHEVTASRNQRAFAAISVGSITEPSDEKPAVVLRYIDCQSGDVLIEERLKASKFGMATDDYQLWSRSSALLSGDGTSLLVRNFRRSARSNKAFFEERVLSKGLPVQARSDYLPVVINGEVVDAGDRWIACEHNNSERGGSLLILEKGSLKTISTIELSNKPVSIAASPRGSSVVCGFMGGAVWVVDTGSGKTRKFSPHVGARRDDWIEVCVADGESYFVSKCNDQLVLTRLEDGVSATAHKLESASLETEPFEGVDTSVKIWPTFAVLGDRFAISEARGVRELSSDPEQYAHRFVSEAGRPGARKPVRVSRKAPLAESVEKARLGKHEEKIIAAHSPGLVISTKKLGKRGWARPGVHHAPELGASRLGGWPDLPEVMPWPMWRNRPMAFLGQLDLAEAHEKRANPLLPADGLLSFFLGCSADTFSGLFDTREQYLVELIFDLEPGDPHGWKVIHTPADAALERQILETEPLPQLFRPTSLRMRPGGKSLPDETSPRFGSFAFDHDERADYLEMVSQLQKEAWTHQLMGYPTIIQFTPPEYYCESRGFHFPQESDADYTAFIERASEWSLLLQLTSDSNPDFLWGDGGHWYFYARREDLLKGDFSNVRVFFEN